MWGKSGAKKRTLAVGKRFGGQRRTHSNCDGPVDENSTRNADVGGPVSRGILDTYPLNNLAGLKFAFITRVESLAIPLALSHPRDLAAFPQGGPKRRALREKTQRASTHTHCERLVTWRRRGRWEIAGRCVRHGTAGMTVRLAACLAAMFAMERTAAGGAHSEGAAGGARDAVERARRAAKAAYQRRRAGRSQWWVRWRLQQMARVAQGGNCPGDGGGDREVTEPTYERVRGMLRVRVEVDGGLNWTKRDEILSQASVVVSAAWALEARRANSRDGIEVESGDVVVRVSGSVDRCGTGRVSAARPERTGVCTHWQKAVSGSCGREEGCSLNRGGRARMVARRWRRWAPLDGVTERPENNVGDLGGGLTLDGQSPLNAASFLGSISLARFCPEKSPKIWTWWYDAGNVPSCSCEVVVGSKAAQNGVLPPNQYPVARSIMWCLA
ncbi:hypothetical protein B0H13DRAFT_1903253 [Mycena leptocephala]|nr:hypothetical protein B0H13DRAFT_1903253 [Mycena leptocephala]